MRPSTSSGRCWPGSSATSTASLPAHDRNHQHPTARWLDPRQPGAAGRGPADPSGRGQVLRRPRRRRHSCTWCSCARRSRTPHHSDRHQRGRGACPASSPCYTADEPRRSTAVQGFVMLPPVFNRPPLADGAVRFVGDIVAAVVAETRAQAVDAAGDGDRRLRPAARGRRRRGRARRTAHPMLFDGARFEPRHRVRLR